MFIIKSPVEWSPVYSWREFCYQRDSNSREKIILCKGSHVYRRDSPNTKQLILFSVLQIRRGNRDNFGVVSLISP